MVCLSIRSWHFLFVLFISSFLVITGCSSGESGRSDKTEESQEQENPQKESESEASKTDLREQKKSNSGLVDDVESVANDGSGKHKDKQKDKQKKYKQKKDKQKEKHKDKHKDKDKQKDKDKDNKYAKYPDYDEKLLRQDGFTLQQFLKDSLTIKDGLSEFHPMVCEKMIMDFGTILYLHYSYGPAFKSLNDELSHKIFTSYLEKLDEKKIYFTKSEYQALEAKYSDKFDDYLRDRDCSIFFEIADVIQKKFKTVSVLNLQAWQEIYDSANISKDLVFKSFDDDYAIDEDSRYQRLKDNILSFFKYETNVQSDFSKFMTYIKENRINKFLLEFLDFDQESFAEFVFDVLVNSTDKYSNYVEHDKTDNFKAKLIIENFFGIGVSIKDDLGIFRIHSVITGGGAYENGNVKVGDRILAVKQLTQDAKWYIANADDGLEELVHHVKGKKDTEVLIRFQRVSADGEVSVFETKIKRKFVDMNKLRNFTYNVFDVKTSKFNNLPNRLDQKISDQASLDEKAHDVKVGYLKMDSFLSSHPENVDNTGAGVLFANAMKKLLENQAKVVVVDLRKNSGGSLNQGIYILNSLLAGNEGIVERTKVLKNLGTEFQKHVKNPVLANANFDSIPLVFLVSRRSASASELLTQSIKVFSRGIIVGSDRTFGKGLIQRVIGYSLMKEGNKEIVSFTTGGFYSYDGKSMNKIGVSSDIIIPSYDLILKEVAKRQPSFVPEHVEKEQIITDYGFRDAKLLSELSDLYTHRLKTDTQSKSHFVLKLFRYVQMLNPDRNLLYDFKFNQPPLNAKQLLSDISSDEFSDALIDEFRKYIKGYSNFVIEVTKEAHEKINFLEDQSELDELWHSIYEKDYEMRDALSIAADYYRLCSGLGTDKEKLDLKDGCVDR